MCFVIAGLQPKTRLLDSAPQRCPRCGLHQAYTRQVDQYVSLFFIPLLRVKQGEPHLYCERCQQPVDPVISRPAPASPGPATPMCCRCGRTIQSGYRYCPHCGAKQS